MGNNMAAEGEETSRQILQDEKEAAHQSRQQQDVKKKTRYLDGGNEPSLPVPQVTDREVFLRQAEQAFSVVKWKRRQPAAMKRHTFEDDEELVAPKRDPLFTDDEKRLLRESWENFTCDLSGYGALVFQRIFSLHSKIGHLFKYKKGADGMLEDPLVRTHGSRFMHAIGAAVRAVDQPGSLANDVAPAFVNLGRHHVNFSGIDSEYFAIFSGSMLFIWREVLGDSFSREVRRVWLRLFDFMMQHMEYGFKLEQQERMKIKDK